MDKPEPPNFTYLYRRP